MLKKLASQTAYYGLSSIIGRLLNYLLVPFHTAMFDSAAPYGIVSDFYAQAALLNVVFTYGMETTFFQFTAHRKQKESTTFNLVVTNLLLTSFLLSGLLWLFSDSMAQLMTYPERGQFVRWFALILLFDTLAAIPFARLRLAGRARRFAALKLGQITLTVFLNVFFLYVLRKSAEGEAFLWLQPLAGQWYEPGLGAGYVFLANLIANGALLLFLLPEFRGFRPAWDWSRLRPMLVYAYPLLFTGIAYTINEVADRTLLKYLLPADFYKELSVMGAIGVYGACYKLSIFITLAVQAFKYAAEPFFFSQAADAKSPQVFARIMRYFVIACALMVLVVSAEARLLGSLFLRKAVYQQGLVVVPFLLFANTFLGIYYNLSIWFKVTNRTYYGTFISLIGMSITLLLNLALIPVLGFLGSAIATLCCYFVMALTCYLWGQKFYPIPYPLRAISGYLLVAAGLSWLTFSVQWESVWWDQLFRITVILLFIGLVGRVERIPLRRLLIK